MQIKTLVPTALAVTATAVLGGLASRPAQSAWYAKLKKPPYQPPRQAFPIVWPVLYADIAATSAATLDHLEQRGQDQERRAYIAALATNLVLNGSWSWLFFNQRRLGTAAIAAGVLAVSSADLTRRSIAVQGAKAAPLAAYPAWCAFATALSTHIWALNR
ncbi:tryptophan-rich sensory protein [Mycolicibacterium rhodesiae NBB3]|uniref:Tryptophan-rich sensory protein n=1 Tax=Mycolicibacterium rhodesiae (strain NBB3) TaxID=710685 RepID=G8RU00_MYCRN|nr:TspO/MBR family protein [Mycolicibacterium rhodesiae]AEV71653.1 tryptophan-rich sensory protein [Mycolicibacterium rhodesiae NBB3]